MNKVFLTMLFAFSTMIASAQFVALTTVNKVEGIEPVKPSTTEVYEGDVCPTTETDDSWNVTDKIGIGYQVNEKLMIGVTKDEMMDRLDLGVGYSYNVWRGLWVDPNYTMPLKEDEEGNREGSFNLSFSYKF